MLKEVLLELQVRGGIRVGDDQQGMLAVWTDKRTQPLQGPARPTRRLRREIWAAFVNSAPDGRRFLDVTNGSIVMGQLAPPSQGGPWLEIPRIRDETQKDWAREVLDGAQLSAMREVLGEPSWHSRLADELRRSRPDTLAAWNSRRSVEVAARVEQWRQENGLVADLVFSDGRLERERKSEATDVRQRILRALEKMTTEELLQLSIPAKYLLLDPPTERR